MLPRAVNQPELLDEAHHDPAELQQSLQHVAAVNRWLGGRSALLHHVGPRLLEQRTTRILDVGCASGDLPRSVADHARRIRRQLHITACDIHPQMLDIARRNCASYPEIDIRQADALSLPFETRSFDIATIAMTLHHFDGSEQIRILRELARVSSVVIVSELRRTRVNYAGAKLLSRTFWRRNRLTRHDGPLSVLRAFTTRELQDLAAAAGLRGCVHRHFFQRVVLVAEPGDHA